MAACLHRRVFRFQSTLVEELLSPDLSRPSGQGTCMCVSELWGVHLQHWLPALTSSDHVPDIFGDAGEVARVKCLCFYVIIFLKFLLI